jgi:hypothetical protein
MSVLELEISAQVARYLAGEATLAELRRWLLPLVWELSESDGEQGSRLAYRIELRLAEYMNGHWTEEDLRTIFERTVPRTSGLTPNFARTISGVSPSSPSETVVGRTEYVPA